MAESAELMDFVESDPCRVEADPDAPVCLDEAPPLDDDVPPAGTACAGCRPLGHWCAAKCYRGLDTALCMACADGVDCSVVLARLRRVEADWMPSMERESSAAGAVRDVTPLDAAKRVVKDVAAPVLRNHHGLALSRSGERWGGSELADKRRREAAQRRERYAQPARIELAMDGPEEDGLEVEPVVEVEKESAMPKEISPELVRQIQAAPVEESTNALAKRLDVGYNTADKYRKAAGKPSTVTRGRPPGSGLAKAAPKPTGVPIDMENVGPRVRALATPVAPTPVTLEGGAIQVPQGRLDAWFNKLPLERKAEIFFAEVGI